MERELVRFTRVERRGEHPWTPVALDRAGRALAEGVWERGALGHAALRALDALLGRKPR